MSKDQLAEDLRELREEAGQARLLAATFKGAAVRDLLTYASALEREAAELEIGTVNRCVPEPESLLLVGAGLLALRALRRPY